MPISKKVERYLGALAQADIYFLIASGFAQPTEEFAEEFPIVTEHDVVELIERTGWSDVDGLGRDIHAWMTKITDISLIELSDEFHRLFEGAMICPLNETAYIRRDKGAIIGDLCGFYRAFGWTPKIGTGEKADHLIFELQFLGVLLSLLAQAQQQENPERMGIALDAIQKFGADHLGDWLPIVVENILEKSWLEVYRELGNILQRVWDATVKSHAIPITEAENLLPPPPIPTLGPDDDGLVDSPYEPCGFETAPGLVQLRQNNPEA